MEVLRNFNKARKPVIAITMAIGSFLLTACGNDGYGRSIENCKSKDQVSLDATLGSNDKNDPSAILDYALDNSYSRKYRDSSASTGIDRMIFDDLDQLGEIACLANNDAENNQHILFTPAGLRVRQDYIGDQPLSANR